MLDPDRDDNNDLGEQFEGLADGGNFEFLIGDNVTSLNYGVDGPQLPSLAAKLSDGGAPLLNSSMMNQNSGYMLQFGVDKVENEGFGGAPMEPPSLNKYPSNDSKLDREKSTSSEKSDMYRYHQPTLGQLAEQVQLKARSEHEYLPPNDDNDDDVVVCAPGTEHTGRWTKQEHDLFLEGLKKYGREWKKVASLVKTRTVVQTRTHAQKYFQKVQKYNAPNKEFDFEGMDDFKKDEDYFYYDMDSPAKEPVPHVFAPGSAPKRPDLPPPPSPASCGKRKQDELMAAKILAGSASYQDMEKGVSVLTSLKETKVPRLNIVNPESMPVSSVDVPLTPWDGGIRELETAPQSMYTNTTVEQNEFIIKVVNSIKFGDVTSLRALIEAAVNSALLTYHKHANTDNYAIIADLLNRVNERGESCLLLACQCLHSQDIVAEMVNILLDYGASIYVCNNMRQTCLHYTAQVGYANVGRLLLMKGCSVNQIDQNGNTAVHIAAQHGYISFIQLLYDFGANFHIRNKLTRCALDLSSTADVRNAILSIEPRLRTLVLYHEDCLEHAARKSSDWEGPDRLHGIMSLLRNEHLFPSYALEISDAFDKAQVDLLSRIHSPEYIAFVDSLAKKFNSPSGSKELVVPFTPHVQKTIQRQNSSNIKAAEYCDTAFSAGTLQAARRAAGAVSHAVERVLLGRNRNAFCVVRPPGHHAGYNGLLDNAKSCGFCIFNSVAAGAVHALEVLHCERVAIVDIDIHHGNGTEDIVRRYPHPSKLLFISMHLFEKENVFEFFPGSGDDDDTIHNIVNIPLNPLWQDGSTSSAAGTRKTAGVRTPASSGRDAFRQAVSQRLVPTLRAFNPDLILLSTGFDAAEGDVGNTRTMMGSTTEKGMDLRPEDFEWVTREIVKVSDICCTGRLVSVLEGGYGAMRKSGATRNSKAQEGESSLDRSILAQSAVAHVKRLIDPYA